MLGSLRFAEKVTTQSQQIAALANVHRLLRSRILPPEDTAQLPLFWGNSPLFPPVTTALATELAKMTRRQKLHLADHLLTETGAHAKPDDIRGSNAPALTAELRRRLTDRGPGAWLTLDELRAQTRPR